MKASLRLITCLVVALPISSLVHAQPGFTVGGVSIGSQHPEDLNARLVQNRMSAQMAKATTDEEKIQILAQTIKAHPQLRVQLQSSALRRDGLSVTNALIGFISGLIQSDSLTSEQKNSLLTSTAARNPEMAEQLRLVAIAAGMNETDALLAVTSGQMKASTLTDSEKAQILENTVAAHPEAAESLRSVAISAGMSTTSALTAVTSGLTKSGFTAAGTNAQTGTTTFTNRSSNRSVSISTGGGGGGTNAASPSV